MPLGIRLRRLLLQVAYTKHSCLIKEMGGSQISNEMHTSPFTVIHPRRQSAYWKASATSIFPRSKCRSHIRSLQFYKAIRGRTGYQTSSLLVQQTINLKIKYLHCSKLNLFQFAFKKITIHHLQYQRQIFLYKRATNLKRYFPKHH